MPDLRLLPEIRSIETLIGGVDPATLRRVIDFIAERDRFLEDFLAQAHFRPGVKATDSGTQSIPNAAATAVNFNTEVYDDWTTAFTATDSKFFARAEGRFRVSSSVKFASHVTGERGLILRANGTTDFGAMLVGATSTVTATTLTSSSANGPDPHTHTVDTHHHVANDGTQLCVVGTIVLAEGEFVEVLAYQTSGGALNVINAFGGPTLSMEKIG